MSYRPIEQREEPEGAAHFMPPLQGSEGFLAYPGLAAWAMRCRPVGPCAQTQLEPCVSMGRRGQTLRTKYTHRFNKNNEIKDRDLKEIIEQLSAT